MDLLGPLAGLAEKLFGDRARRRAADLRIADGARRLLRQLAYLPDWPADPVSGQNLSGWAAWLSKSMKEGEPELKALVGLRPEASPRVQRAIGEARDHFEQAIALLGALFGKDFSMSAWDDDRRHGIIAKLRRAVGHVRECRDALRSVVSRP